jgi:predicted Rossmann fold nucleotide-binding protein DprA/Smf involved in DNA uptake
MGRDPTAAHGSPGVPDAVVAAAAGSGSLGGAARAVLNRLRNGPASVDELADALRTPAAQVNRSLTMLELEGLARASGAGEWEAA